ncbi:MAG: hypothetical protein E7585_00135 [Ruminococcaceae bacterium]|nr:hypothetical protein [Oscillospiraceae bacterium]
MNTKDYLKKIAIHTCIYFTGATLLLIYIYFLFSASSGIHPLAQLLILPFSLLFALANVQFQHATIKIAWRVVIHYALTVGGMFCLLYLPNKAPGATASQGLFLFIGLTFIYAIVMGILLILRARIQRVRRDTKHYKGVYQNKDNEKQKKDLPNHKEITNKKPNKSKAQDADDYQNVFKKK